jgi:hypothetical protein
LLRCKRASILILRKIYPGIGLIFPVGEGTSLTRVFILGSIKKDSENQSKGVKGDRFLDEPIITEENVRAYTQSQDSRYSERSQRYVGLTDTILRE